MKLPIEQQTKTAANDWFVLETDGQTIAIPEGWLKGGVGRFDGVSGLSYIEALKQADWALGPGSHRGSLRDIDHLHGSVNDIYTLVDEGYVDGRKAILAFR
tara:strand:+ start:641 stop:943 length:303 start_codon:yes stop_codon:yes gene_type:complete